MELLFVVLGGAILGVIAHVALPAPDTRGALLAPAVGAASAGQPSQVRTSQRTAADGGWIWVVSLVVPAIAAGVVCRVTTRSRRAHDDELVARLMA
jgi:hypothetical protein